MAAQSGGFVARLTRFCCMVCVVVVGESGTNPFHVSPGVSHRSPESQRSGSGMVFEIKYGRGFSRKKFGIFSATELRPAGGAQLTLLRRR